MYYNANINQPKNIQKNKNIYQPNFKIFQSPSQQYQNLMYNNNNINFINYNIKVNKIKNLPKEKIIEGDLNFNDKKIYHTKIQNKSKHNKNRNKPTKSPVPVPKDYKPSNFQYKKLLYNNNFMQNSNSNLKPKSAYPRKNNFINNSNNVNNVNKNNIKPNFLGINSNFPSNKTYNAFNVFKKNLERTHSPLLRTSGTNNGIHFVQKDVVKSRYISKSPILSKGSIFNRYKMSVFGGGSNNSSSMNSISNNQKDKKRTPIKNNQKKISGQKKQSINYNINNMRNKGPTLISGEIVQDSTNNGKFNINNMNKINNQMNNYFKNKKVNNDSNNFKPVYNPQNLKIDSNNALLNINAQQSKDKDSNKALLNINAPPSKDKDSQKVINDKADKKINLNININNNIPKKENININNIPNNNQLNANIKINDNNKENTNKNNQRSLSQGVVNPLQKNSNEQEKENQQTQEKSQKQKKQEKEKEKEKETLTNEKKIVKKIIKDILPYTHVGFDGEEPKENNQDNYFIYKNFMNKKDYIYMSVCDGHGVEGHFVSDFIKETLPHDMSESLQKYNILTENEKEKEKIYQIIKETFIMTNEKLVDNEDINSLFSGSTCVSLIYTPVKLIVPNIGDSRAVLGRLVNKETNEYKAIDLSRDHKPTEKDEAQRIIDNDGRIQPFTEDGEFVGPERVWIKEEEVPGLAMTRSFGDRVAATVGVMSEPEIKEFTFEEGDKFMIIASDGIWEFISSQECIDIIKVYYDKNDLKGCCEYLYQESSKRWLKEEEVIDDTTLIIVFFE